MSTTGFSMIARDRSRSTLPYSESILKTRGTRQAPRLRNRPAKTHAAARRPPRPPAESVLGAGLWKRILRIAVLITAVTLAVALWGRISGTEWQTMAFLTLGTMQLTVAIALRARPRTSANPFLLVAVGSAWLLQLSAVYVPPLAELLGTQPLSLRDLAVVTGVSLLGYAGIRLDRKLHPR
jgi:Ca2+-transporting ATPase